MDSKDTNLENILQDLKVMVSDILLIEVSEINGNDAMKSLGFDSVSIGFLKDKINEKYNLELSMDELFQNDTLTLLAQFICSFDVNNVGISSINDDLNVRNNLRGMKLNKVPVIYSNQPIWLLDFYSADELDELEDFWDKAQKREYSYLKTNHLSTDYYKYIYSNEKGKAAHLLVENDNGNKIEAVVMGQGEPIVIIGGIGMTASATMQQAKKWSEKYMVINLHPPGCGFSDDQEFLGVNDISESFFQTLLKLGIDMPMHLIGYSWGGMIVQDLAYRYPKFVSSVILSNAVYEVVNITPEINGDMQMTNEFNKIKGGEKYIPNFRKSVSLNPKIAVKYDDYYSEEGKYRQSTLDILDKITQPVLIIESGKDGFVTKDVSNEIKNRIKNSTVYYFENASHFPFFTHAQKYNEVVMNFINGHSGAARCSEKDIIDELKTNIDIEKYAPKLNKAYDVIANKLNQSSIDDYDKMRALLKKICLNNIIYYFETNDYFYSKGDKTTVEDMINRLGIIPDYTKLFKYFLNILEEHNVIQIDNNDILFLKSYDDKRDTLAIKNELIFKDERMTKFIELLEYAKEHTKDLISGKSTSYDVIFNGEALDFTEERYYTDEAVVRVVVAKLIDDLIKSKKGGRKLRILEIGAGSGRMLRQIAPLVDVPDVEYCFTDVGRYFVAKIQEEKLTQYVQYRQFDIFSGIEEQGFEKEHYDVVIALNVMHVIDKLDKGMLRVKELLKENGIGVMMELNGGAPWLDMVWGLLKDWWNFDDFRKNSPLLSDNEWVELGRKCGFKNVEVVPQNRKIHSLADVNIILFQKSSF